MTHVFELIAIVVLSVQSFKYGNTGSVRRGSSDEEQGRHPSNNLQFPGVPAFPDEEGYQDEEGIIVFFNKRDEYGGFLDDPVDVIADLGTKDGGHIIFFNKSGDKGEALEEEGEGRLLILIIPDNPDEEVLLYYNKKGGVGESLENERKHRTLNLPVTDNPGEKEIKFFFDKREVEEESLENDIAVQKGGKVIYLKQSRIADLLAQSEMGQGKKITCEDVKSDRIGFEEMPGLENMFADLKSRRARVGSMIKKSKRKLQRTVGKVIFRR